MTTTIATGRIKDDYYLNDRPVYREYPALYGAPPRTDRVKKQIITVHERTCPVIKSRTWTGCNPSDGQIAALATNGYDDGGRNATALWQGCRRCGTDTAARALQQRAAAELTAAADAEALAALRRLDRQARDAARTGLRDARATARAALAERLLEQHADALAAAEDAAEAAWRDANPALAALVGGGA